MAGSRTETLEAGQVLSGRYEILRLVGRGGMGTVYEARQLGLNRSVAIKVLHDEALKYPDAMARFRREALVAQKLTHPNTVRLYDVGETAGRAPFLVLEHLVGLTLDEVLRRQGGPMPLAAVAHMGKQVLKSLTEAHNLGIIHRDLKPSNLMLCRQIGEVDFIKVLDFGLARLLDEEGAGFRTRTGFIVGTVRYMAPEHAMGEASDERSEIYSLGVSLYELATGTLPYLDLPPLQAALKRSEGAPLPLLEPLRGSFLEAIVLRATEASPGDRYSSARSMLEDLTTRTPEPWPGGKNQGLLEKLLLVPASPEAEEGLLAEVEVGGAGILDSVHEADFPSAESAVAMAAAFGAPPNFPQLPPELPPLPTAPTASQRRSNTVVAWILLIAIAIGIYFIVRSLG